jgi:Tfp pilus assembly protein PilF
MLRQNQLERALQEFEEVLRIDPENTTARNYLQQTAALRAQAQKR